MSFEPPSENRKISRRRFLLSAWAASIVVLSGQSFSALLRFFQPMAEPGSFGGKVNIGNVSEFPLGSVTHVQKGRFYVSHVDEGILAMWHRCTHLGCTVPWSDGEDQFHCPCHGGLYNTKGEVLGGPPPRPLDLFPVEIADGDIIVDTSHVIERSQYDPAQATPV
ncbi:MAG: Rieske 2Fe-2S domain-containing protein [Caldilineales bacterium]|nr:Rieske 2Fe-2S domain-containing protein [Caldilineales bacterium]